MKFRSLNADEVEIRIGTCSEKGVSLLLYKDARCDMNILDEVVGAMDWKREHTRDNKNCIVSIWDKDKNQWISKEDTGTESFSEAEKGLASDSFKRACFNWGIGRELYTAGLIWINAAQLDKHSQYNGKWTCKDNFSIETFEVDSERNVITKLSISNKKGVVFSNLNLNPAKTKKTNEKQKKENEKPKNEKPKQEEPKQEEPKQEEPKQAEQPQVTQETIDHSKGVSLDEIKKYLSGKKEITDYLEKIKKTIDLITETKLREWYNKTKEKEGK